MIGDIIARHERIVLQFSGGKDSIATLHLMRPWWDKILVVWANSGDAFPETIAQMAAVKEMVPHFFMAKADQPAQIAANGWPADIISVDATPFGNLLRHRNAQTLQPYPACCGANLWGPMQAAIAAFGATLVIRGTRKDDARRSMEEPGSVHGGIEFLFPVWDWSADEVMAFLRANGIEVPAYYEMAGTSLDCQHCTAYLDENAGKMRYIAKHHPDLSAEVQRRLRAMREIVMADVEHIEKAVL